MAYYKSCKGAWISILFPTMRGEVQIWVRQVGFYSLHSTVVPLGITVSRDLL